MDTNFRRNKFRHDPHGLKRDLATARDLFRDSEYLKSLDVYEQLVTLYPNAAVEILAEVCDCYKRFPYKDRYRLYQARLFDFGIDPGDKVLDMGSGHIPFPLATHLADISLENHQYGRAGVPFKHVDGMPVFECNVENTPFADKEFEFVYCSHVLEHTRHPERACEELMRIAKRGYIETPLKAKDILLDSARVSNHTMAVEAVDDRLVFTPYAEEEIEGMQCDILMQMHIAPRTQREKAFSALIYLKPHLFNTMFTWEDRFEYEVRSMRDRGGIHREPRNPGRAAEMAMTCAAGDAIACEAQINPTDPAACEPVSVDSATCLHRPNRHSRLKFMQVHTYYPHYLTEFYQANPSMSSAPSEQQIDALIQDGFSAVHIFPPYMGAVGYDARMVIANNPHSQRRWLGEQGLTLKADRDWVTDVTRLQVEDFKPDILYLSDPITFDSRFVRSLAHSPKLVIGWRAANIPPETDWSEFDVMMSSLARLRDTARKLGARSVEHFFPGFPSSIYHEIKSIRPEYDVAFTGQWTLAQHPGRNRYLECLARSAGQVNGGFSLAYYLSGQLDELPPEVASYDLGGRFGISMHRALRSGRIAFDARGLLERKSGNDIIDLASGETANMRIFEATGSGVFLLTEYFDNLSQYFEPGREIETFRNETELLDKIRYYLSHPEERERIADNGRKRCHNEYSMERRAEEFDRIIRSHLPAGPETPVSISGEPRPEESVPDLLSMASDALDSDDVARAFKLLNKAKSLKVPQSGLDGLRAICFLRMNRPVDAREALREELRFFPDNSQAKKMLDRLQDQDPVSQRNEIDDPAFMELLETIRPFTMSSEKRLYSLYSLAKKVCEMDIPGHFVECGVAAGGSTALLAAAIKRFSRRPRKLYAFDSFEGMPAPTAEDLHGDMAAEDTGWGSGTCAAPETSVEEICRRLEVSDIVETVKGYFEDTLPQTRSDIGPIAMLHMDGDWYESTRSILNNLYDQVETGGIIQVDDYGHWQGCRQALDEFIQLRRVRFEIEKIDYTGIWFSKPDNPDSMPVMLNLGCGQRYHPDWTNVDFRATSSQVMEHNLREGIPFGNASFDVIYHSHLLEHFSRSYAVDFMRECFRVLKPGGILRVVVPDLEQIVRCYLDNLEGSLTGDELSQKKYDWILLELFDQMVRNESGGEMLAYWKTNPMPAEAFVIERQGSEVLDVIRACRRQDMGSNPVMYEEKLSQEQIGRFRQSGEIHQWMYDRYSLSKLLAETGFTNIEVCRAGQSEIRNFNAYHLDVEPDGSIRKPDSLFVEARKLPDIPRTSKQRRPSPDRSMRVVHLCMQDFGGAGKAAYRLHKGLQAIGMQSAFLVMNKKSGDPSVKVLPSDFAGDKVSCLDVAKHQSPLWNRQVQRWHRHLSKYPGRPSGLEMFTDAESGVRLDLIREVEQADIVNLHWVAGTMDYSNAALALRNKPVVWTLHDMNPFTGGCHYAGDCQKYKTMCQECPQLGSDDRDDLSRQVWTQKFYVSQSLNIDIVSPSRWLGGCAGQSALFSSFPVHVIPYGFPLETFKPYPKKPIRKEAGIPESATVILFGADSVTNQRKGFVYLLEALNRFPANNGHNFVLMTFGNLPRGIQIPSRFQIFNAGQIANEDQLAMIYSAADLFVLPSLEDNHPNTVVEAMACGLPVVGFDIGGVPDMVEHRHTGYLVRPGDIADLNQGIQWIAASADNGADFSKQCRQRVESRYALDMQATAYRNLYRGLLQ